MADPIPVNTRQERNPQPVVTPFGNRPPFGNLPARPNPAANAVPRPAPRPVGNAQSANRQPPQGTLFERRQPRRAQGQRGQGSETVMHAIAAIILIAVVVLSYLAQSPPSQVTAFDPRAVGAVAQAQPTSVSQPTTVPPTPVPYSPARWDWGAPGAYTGIDAWVTERTLIRACPNESCVALSNPTILEVGLLTDLVGIDPTRGWVQINASRPGGTMGSGWILLTAIRPNGDVNRLPVIAA